MKKKAKLLPPPWKQSEPEKMLVVHMSSGELEGLDNLQGGPSIDVETGLREYSKLAPIIEKQEVRDLFYHVNDELRSKGKLSPTLNKIYKTAKTVSLPYVDAPADKNPIIHELEETGRGQDKHLALLPMNFVMFLIELHPKVSINPKTNLLQFGIFKNVMRVVGTVGRPLLGGAISGGLGGLSPMLGTAASSLLSGSPMLGSTPPSIEQQFLSQARQSAGVNPTSSSAGLLDSLGLDNSMMPLMMGALHWKKPSKRNLISNPDFRYDERAGSMSGPMYLDSGAEYAKGGHVLQSYNKGTLIKGPGDGQADKIKTSIPEGSYIFSADVVSGFGNGSSDQGGKVLKKFEDMIRHKAGKHNFNIIGSYVKKATKPIPVWLSNDEYKFDPTTVTTLGDGSNAKGAKILKSIVNNLRKHQISNGNNLPPKAKNPMRYIKDAHYAR